MGARKPRKVFDKAYYDRFYHNDETCVIDDESLARLGDFVCAYMRHLEIDVRRVLDAGCGLGKWRGVIERNFAQASYYGLEVSEYLCNTYGWEQASLSDYKSSRRFDLVVCQGVLQYLDDKQARAAIANLAELTRGAVFLEVLTSEDWERNCDQDATDNRCHLREAAWYTKQLSRHFVNCGGGVFLAKKREKYLYALDALD